MKISIQVKSLFRSMNIEFSQTFSKFSRKLNCTKLFPQSPVLPVSLPSTNPPPVHEAHSTTVGLPVPEQQNNDQPEKIDWEMIVFGFCMESAVDIALQSVEDHDYTAFHWLSLLILFTFTTLFVAKFMRHKFRITSQVLEAIGLLLAASAFCYAVSIPFPYVLKCITWATFGISLLAVFTCKYFFKR